MEIKQQRNMGIELLRIVSMFMVVTLHVLGQGGVLSSSKPDTAIFNIAWFLEIATYCAVNCYALISGYVGLNSKHRVSSFALLWLQVAFYSGLIAVILYFTDDVVTRSEIFEFFMPAMYQKYWYFTAYFAMWFFIPVMNAAIHNLSFKRITFILSASTVILLPMELFETAFKMNNGYGVLWLCYLYLLGAYFAKYDLLKRISPVLSFFIYLSAILTSYYYKIFITNTKELNALFVNYMSPFILISAVSLLSLFSKLKIHKAFTKVIGLVSSLSFSVYLIHTHPLVFYNSFKGAFSFLTEYKPLAFVGGVIVSIIAVFTACILIDAVRLLLFKAIKIKQLLSFIENKILKLACKRG